MTFKALLADLGLFVKSQATSADDAAIQAAAASGGDSNNGQGAGAAAGAGGAAADGAGGAGDAGAAGAAGAGAVGGDEDLNKSFEVTLENGDKLVAQDAGPLLKALHDKINANEAEAGEVITMCVDLIKSQAAQLADLRGQFAKLAGSGGGRKAVISLVPKAADGAGAGGGADLTKSQSSISSDDFFTKALAMQKAGTLTSREIATAEAHMNRGEPIPADLIRRVMA